MNPQVTILKSRLNAQGGLEKYAWHLAHAFCKKNSPVTLLTTEPVTPPFEHPLLKIVSLSIRCMTSYFHVRNFECAAHDFLEKHPTPIIFGLDRNRFQTHLRAGNGSHAAYLHHRSLQEGVVKQLSFRCNPLHRLILSIEKASFENPRLRSLFTNSHLVKREILALYDTPPEKIHVIHNGVEWTALQPSFDAWHIERERLLTTHGLDSNAYQLLFVGHNFRRKGLEPLLHALKGLPIQLSVVGSDKQIGFYRSLAHKLGLNVRFFETKKDPRPFYQMADSLAIPSLYDPFANVTVEALAMGLFVISSRTNGGHEVLNPLSGAIIDHPLDPSTLREALMIALSRPKTPASSLQIRASVEHLDFPNQLNAMVDACLF